MQSRLRSNSRSGFQKTSLRISDISCAHLSRLGPWHLGQGFFYLSATLGSTTKRTAVSRSSNTPSWNEFLTFDIETTGLLSAQVFAQHSFRHDELIGELKTPIEIGLDFDRIKKFSGLALVHVGKKNSIVEVGTVGFFLERLSYSDASDSLSRQVEQTNANLTRTLPLPSSIINNSSSEYGPWESLLGNIRIVVEVVDEVAKIHPYAEMAWSILSPVLKAVVAQQNRDQGVLSLLLSMHEMYNFVTRVMTLSDLDESRREVLKRMLQQTYDCSWFIRDYMSRKFVARGINAVITGHDLAVQQYVDTFTRLKTNFQDQSSIRAEITVCRTLAITEDIFSHQMLDDMKCATDLETAKECLPGTRTAILSEIIDWINRPPEEEGRCLYWLHGVAGCGKSAIASTISRYFRGLGRCVSLFFDASSQNELGPRHLFSTLSRELADLDPQRKASLVEVVKHSWELRTTSNIKKQFENFILKPAAEFQPLGPIVIVIDALNESGSVDESAPLLEMLTRVNELELYGHFRFLITSRPREDIQQAFGNRPWILSKDLTRIDTVSTDKDIRRYVDSELSDQPDLIEEWPDKPWLDLFVARAEHLFQWAFVACSFLKGSGQARRGMTDPVQRYIYLRDDTTNSRLHTLDKLYRAVLQGSYESGGDDGHESDEEEMARLRTVLGRVMSTREPLSLRALTELRPDGERSSYTGIVLRQLDSLLRGVNTDNEPIQPLHASFLDFLKDPERSGQFHITPSIEDKVLAISCLRILNKLLRFNICRLETSYVCNRDVDNLSNRIQDNIPEHLSYACLHFMEHLDGCEWSLEAEEMIRGFLLSKLLFWLEVMSLLEEMHQALVILSGLHTWTQKNPVEGSLKEFAGEAERFIRACGGTMAISTPHIYLSSLAFIPSHSPLYHAYANKFPGGIQVSLTSSSDNKRDSNGNNSSSTEPLGVSWTPTLLQIKASDIVTSIAFSPDGKQLVSASRDRTIWIWDAYTGQLAAGPFMGHTRAVTCVEFLLPDGKRLISGSHDCAVCIWDVHRPGVVRFLEGHTRGVASVASSPNGNRVVSGAHDGTVRIWDAYTGDLIAGPFEGHDHWVTSVGFSPDGMNVVSGSHDCTVRVWDAYTGALVAEPFEGHTKAITSVKYSPGNGAHILSGSHDGTIRLWNALTGELVIESLVGHTGGVSCIAFLPDGSGVVSGSFDKTVWVQDIARTPGALIAGPFEGHTDWVRAVNVSPRDGKRIASCSNDGTVRIWDAHAGALVAGRFEEHVDARASILAVAFSPNGERIVTGSDDRTVCIWDAHTGALIVGPCIGHTDVVTSVAFSPHGQRIVSGSTDMTVRVWDSYTSELIAGPFEGHVGAITSVAFVPPDGELIISGSDDRTVLVRNSRTGMIAANLFDRSTGAVTSVAVSPDGKHVVSGSRDSTVCIWDTYTGELVIGPLAGHTLMVAAVAFASDGRYIASGSWDRTVRLWNVPPLNGSAHPDDHVTISPSLRGHTLPVTSVAFTSDSTLVASGSHDLTVRLWDAHTGSLVAGPFKGHTDIVTCVRFSIDGRQIVSGSQDSTIRVWDMGNAGLHHNFLPEVSKSIAIENQTYDDELVHYTDTSTIDDGGWVLGPSRELLFWIPVAYRKCLYRPSNTLVIGKNALKLDLDRFTHGPVWQHCYSDHGDNLHPLSFN